MEKEVDVLVVGGCSAGLFFAERMAKQGYKTLVIEKDPADKLAKRYDIFHLAKQTFERFAVPIPQQGDSDFVQIFSEARSRSALDNYPKVSST
jgi:heterodisulfide reductase subunit A-like polyferredoxin